MIFAPLVAASTACWPLPPPRQCAGETCSCRGYAFFTSNGTYAARQADDIGCKAANFGLTERDGRCSCAPCRVERPAQVAICFFGINRSLNRTIASFDDKILRPLRQRGVTADTYFHTYSVETVKSGRAGEDGVRVAGAREMVALLKPRAWAVTSQDEFDASLNISDYRHIGLTMVGRRRVNKHRYYYPKETVRNLMRQLNSIRHVTALWATQSHAYKAIILTRPDLIYLDDIDVDRLLGLEPDKLLVPYWHSYHGLNDRVSVAGPRFAAQYGARIDLAKQFCLTHPFHAEGFARFALDTLKGVHEPLRIRALRMRATGLIEKNDLCLRSCNVTTNPSCRGHCSGWQQS